MSLKPHLPRQETGSFKKNRGEAGRFASKLKESNIRFVGPPLLCSKQLGQPGL